MLVLGLGGSSHDYSACIVNHGKVQVAIEDERLTRVKHSERLGARKIYQCMSETYCLESLGLTIEDIDATAANHILNKHYYFHLKSKRVNTYVINHHLAHASSAFYPSPFEESAVLIIDGLGSPVMKSGQPIQRESITFYHAQGTKIRPIKKVSGNFASVDGDTFHENSLGRFYLRVTKTIGFNLFDEGKTMGLAPYGTPVYVRDFERFYRVDDSGNFTQSIHHKQALIRFMRDKLTQRNDPEYTFQIKANLAYAMQWHAEQVIIKLCNYLYRKVKSKNLCYAGGVALNSVVNRKILEYTNFEHVFIQPAAGDAGTSIGSALYVYHNVGKNDRETSCVPFSPYLGREYTEHEIASAINKFSERVEVMQVSNVCSEAAHALSQGKIIGWFQGRSEIGPRALGNRSILADPRDPRMKDVINSRIKHREFFRPFAPVILEEAQEIYFAMSHPSYYMLFVPQVRFEQQSVIPAVTHVDGTGRLQTISKSLNPMMHSLLSKFNTITGVPVLLNTSFNDNGEPIVETPYDAIHCFCNTDLDKLFIGNYVLSKKATRSSH